LPPLGLLLHWKARKLVKIAPSIVSVNRGDNTILTEGESSDEMSSACVLLSLSAEGPPALYDL